MKWLALSVALVLGILAIPHPALGYELRSMKWAFPEVMYESEGIDIALVRAALLEWTEPVGLEIKEGPGGITVVLEETEHWKDRFGYASMEGSTVLGDIYAARSTLMPRPGTIYPRGNSSVPCSMNWDTASAWMTSTTSSQVDGSNGGQRCQ